jgi:hypothetical protein
MRASSLLRPAVLLLLLAAGACSTWHAEKGPAPQVVAARGGGRLRIVRQDQSVVELVEARVVGDSIVGLDGSSLRHVAVATSDVLWIGTRRVDVAHTAALAVGVVAAFAVVAYFAVIRPVFGNPRY